MGRDLEREWTPDMSKRATAVMQTIRGKSDWVDDWKCYTLADGFYPGFHDSGAEYDWSHIRDSSWEAFEEMEELLRLTGALE